MISNHYFPFDLLQKDVIELYLRGRQYRIEYNNVVYMFNTIRHM